RVAEQVKLRDRHCVFPYCHRAATHADIDHNVPYDPDGPDDQTSTTNLAVLCRLHHRMKTHCGWSYTMIEPGIFHWRSPYGYTYRRDRTGTTDLTPGPLEPPVEPPDPPPDH
ncbi:MAG: HNH endonuclease signature motif containing protein, partial [Nocardioides sp.]